MSQLPPFILSRKTIDRVCATTLLVVMGTVFSFAVINNMQMNAILLGVMCIASLILFIRFPFISKKETPIYFFVGAMVISALCNIHSFRFLTIFYTLMFVLTFMYYGRLIFRGALDQNSYIYIIKFLIYAYCITLIIQQICVITGLPVFNRILTGIEQGNMFKLNSLSLEPSHTAVILILLMLSYVKMKECFLGRKYELIADIGNDKFVWIAFLYTMLTMGSGAAFLFLPLFFLYFLKLKDAIIYLLFFISVGLLIIYFWDIPPVQRVERFVGALLTGDLGSIYQADHSASVRIAPAIIYIRKIFNVCSLNTWIGYGVDANKIFSALVPGVPEKVLIGGFFPSLPLNFGIITFGGFLWMIKKYCFGQLFSYPFFLWFFMLISMGINTYITWFSLMLLMTNHYFERISKLEAIDT